jgi:hypothetical protein
MISQEMEERQLGRIAHWNLDKSYQVNAMPGQACVATELVQLGRPTGADLKANYIENMSASINQPRQT